MEKHTVSIAFVKEALASLDGSGVNPGGPLIGAGIPPLLLQSAHTRVSARSFAKLWLEVAHILDDEFFGLDSRRMKVGSFALLCRTMAGGATLRAAITRAQKVVRLILDDVDVRLDEQGSKAALVVRSSRQGPRMPFAHETLLIMLYGLACWLVNRRIPIVRAQFGYARPERWAEYTTLFSRDVAFSAEDTRLIFDSAYLDVDVVQNAGTAGQFLKEAPYNIVVKYRDIKSWAARVRRILRDGAPAWMSFGGIARRLQVAPPTLRRRLEREGTSLRGIKDELRRDMAIERLCETDQSIAEIANAVGFAEPSAFHRAFKHWTGARPGEYRQ